MDTTHLLEGLQIFAIGFGGVFLVLAMIWLAIAILGRVVGGRPETKQAEH